MWCPSRSWRLPSGATAVKVTWLRLVTRFSSRCQQQRMAPRPAAEVEQALARIQRQRPLDEAGLVLRALGAQLVAVDVEIAVAEKALVPGRVAHRHTSLADGLCVYTGERFDE